MKKLILIPLMFLSLALFSQTYVVIKPSQLPAASTINLTDLFILNQGTTTKKLTYSILNTELKDTFATKSALADSSAALRAIVGPGSGFVSGVFLKSDGAGSGVPYANYAEAPKGGLNYDGINGINVKDTGLSVTQDGYIMFQAWKDNAFLGYESPYPNGIYFENSAQTAQLLSKLIYIGDQTSGDKWNDYILNITKNFSIQITPYNTYYQYATQFVIDSSGIKYDRVNGQRIFKIDTTAKTSLKYISDSIILDPATGLKYYKGGVKKFEVDTAGRIYHKTIFSDLYRDTDLTITASQNVWYKITGLTTKFNSGTTIVSDSIQLPKGYYKNDVVVSLSGLNNENWQIAVFKNGAVDAPRQQRYTSTSDVGDASVQTRVYSDGDDWFTIKIRNITDADDPTIKYFYWGITETQLDF